MGVLIEAQWRLIRRSFWLWTGIGLVSMAFLGANSSATLGIPEKIPFFSIILAAALGPRLFARESLAGEGIYVRSLPLAVGPIIILKFVVGFLALFLNQLLYLFIWHSGLVGQLNSWIFDREVTTPTIRAWKISVLIVCATFAASSYFTTFFERSRASRQAGVPAFCGGLLVVGLLLVWIDLNPGLIMGRGLIHGNPWACTVSATPGS